MRKLTMLAAFTVVTALALPAQAIKSGVPDERRHPYVGQLFFYDPDGPIRGSTTRAAGSTAPAR